MMCLGSARLHDQTSVDTVANYKSWGWKAIVMQNEFITVATVPAIGGRVMQYDLGSHSSIFINPAELGKTFTPTNGAPWNNFGGTKPGLHHKADGQVRGHLHQLLIVVIILHSSIQHRTIQSPSSLRVLLNNGLHPEFSLNERRQFFLDQAE